MVQEKILNSPVEVKEVEDTKRVVLFNDNHNTFDHVIATLVELCDHTPEQAEQCAVLVHTKGKCTVKEGSYKDMAALVYYLGERDLTVELV